MMVLSVDATPWVIVTTALGALFGALFKRPLYGVFAVFATFFSIYSTVSLFGLQYNTFVAVSWLLSAFFGASSISNLVATWIRRIEMELRTMREQLEILRLAVEER